MSRLRFIVAMPPAALVTGVEGGDVVADVVPDDHAVAHVVEKACQRLFLVNPPAGFVARDAVHGDGAGVLRDLQERVERILEQDLAPADGDGADRDDAIGTRIEAGRLGVEHHEPH